MATGPIGNRNALAEAARRRAQEEARRRAEEARRKAEEEARRKAAEEAQRKAAEEAQKKAAAEQAKKAEGAQEPGQRGAVGDLVDKGRKETLKKKVEPITPDDAQKEQKGIQDDIKKAKSPEDVKKVSERASKLEERVKITEDPRIDRKMREEVSQTKDDLAKASKALTKLEDSKKALEGNPEERANETARLLANPEEVQNSIKDLKALKDSPVLEKAQKDVNAIVDKADPSALADQLSKQPDLSKYAPEMAKNLATLRQVEDPKLQKSLDKVGENLLNKEGGLNLEDVKKNPALGQLLAPMQNSSDPAVRQKLEDTVKSWAKESIAKNLEGKEKKEGAEQAMEAFKSDMTELAKSTGLGATIQAVGPKAVEESKDQIEDVAKKGEGFFSKVGGFFGDVVGGVGKFFDKGFDVLGGAVGFVGTTAGKAVDLLGDGIDFVADTQGKLNGALIKGAGALAGEGLEALGAEKLGKAVKETSKDAGEMVEKAYDKVGDTANSFVDGVGGALKGTTDGLAFIIKEPTQAAKGVYALGKAAVTGDTETLKAMGKALTDEAFINPKTGKFDVAYGTGYIAANIIPMIATGGGSSAASGANAVAKGAQAANVAAKGAEAANLVSKAGRLSNFAGRANQVLEGAKALTNLDVAGVVNTAKAMRAPLEVAEDGARFARTKALINNPKKYTTDYANHLKGNARVAQGQLRQNVNGLRESASNILQNPRQAFDDLAKQTGSNFKKTRLTTKLAAKSALRGLRTHDMAHFQKAIEYMNKNPMVQGLNTAATRGLAAAEVINNPLKPITGRLENAVNNNFNAMSRIGQRGTEAALDTMQTAAEEQKKTEDAAKEAAKAAK